MNLPPSLTRWRTPPLVADAAPDADPVAVAVAVPAPGPNPGLRGRFEVTANSWVTDRPRSVHFPEGHGHRNWEGIAPPKNDLGGIRRRLRLDC